MELYDVDQQVESHTKKLSDEYICDLISEAEVITTKSAVNLKTPFQNKKNCHNH